METWSAVNAQGYTWRRELALKLQYSGHLMQRADSLEKILVLGKTEGREKGTTEDVMVGWHHRLNGFESE